MKNVVDIVVIGGGGHSKSIISTIKKMSNFNLVGYTDIENKGDILSIPYIGQDKSIFEKGIRCAVMGISYLNSPKDIDLRLSLIKKYKSKGLKFPSIIANSANLNEGVIVSEGTVVMENVFINSGCQIGSFCVINSCASIDHDCIIGNDSFISPGVVVCGDVQIGNKVFIGAGSIIKDSITISDNIVIGTKKMIVQ